MDTNNETLAARFFFKNCAVSIFTSGDLAISRTIQPRPGDVIFDRNFIPADSPSEFINAQCDFYRFLDATSTTNDSILKKLSAIGYMLCNKLPRGNWDYRAFICVNEEDGACRNGKTVFSQAIAHYCHPIFIQGPNFKDPFWLEPVTENANLLIIDGLSARTDFCQFFSMCPGDWHINRRFLDPLIIDREKAPSVLLIADTSVDSLPKYLSFRRRFDILEFSSFFSAKNTIRDYLGHDMFYDWDTAQWHMFDNFMLYCVMEYLRSCYKSKFVIK